MILDDKLAGGGVVVLDGATGTEISRLGGQIDSAAWCAVANKTDPGIVRTVHEEYIRAGSDVITTNTFGTARHVLAGAGLAEETVAINRRAVELATAARERVDAGRPVAIAGSMSCMVAWEPGSTSADHRYLPSPEQESANYREVAETLAEAGVDFLIMEMMLDLERAHRAVEAAVSTGLPVWVGMSCTRRTDGKLVGWDQAAEEPEQVTGDDPRVQAPPLGELIDRLMRIGGQVAGIMHSSIETTTPAVEELFKHWDGPVMAYPETVQREGTPGQRGSSVSPADFATAARGLVERGVQIIGGCCGTTVEHIRALVDELPAEVGPRPVGTRTQAGAG